MPHVVWVSCRRGLYDDWRANQREGYAMASHQFTLLDGILWRIKGTFCTETHIILLTCA